MYNCTYHTNIQYTCIYASILYICLYDINNYAHFYAYIYYKHRKMNIFDVTRGIVPARKPLYIRDVFCSKH